MGLDIEPTPDSSAGNQSGNADQSYLNDFEGDKTGNSPSPEDDKSSGTSTDGAGEENPNGKQEPSSLDVVEKAMKGLSEGGESPHPEGEGKDGAESKSESGEGEGEEGAEGEQLDEDGKKLPPFHEHPRWKEMVEERNRYKEQVEQLEPVKRQAESYQQIDNFLRESNLGGEDFRNGLEIMRLMRNDPERALQAIEPYVEQLKQSTGKILPSDLQQQVENGAIDEQTAYSYAAERARAQRLEQQNYQLTERQQREQEQRQQAEAQRRQQEALKPMYDAVAQWEAKWKANDPDHAKLSDLVRFKAQEMMQKEQPRTPEDAVKLADRALKEAKDYVKQFQPSTPKDREPLPNGGNSGQQPKQQPKSGKEVVDLALQSSS